ncbi:MAG: sigma-70 family RNA polymerase sigma factor [Chthoniobacterales bacterium]|nr:sigma-70 family RNA polymerase sigma factor [Chthoniobacterales bacterium]
MMVENEINWPEALRASGRESSAAVDALRGILLNGLRIVLRERSDVGEAQLEDFTQEALLRVLERLDQFAGRSKFTTWAHAIAVNTAFTELRRKRWQDVSLDALTADGHRLQELMVMPDDPGNDDEERAQVLEVLRQAVAEKLSDKQRVLILSVLRGIPFDQIVQLSGTTRNSAYKLFHDARRALKHHLTTAGLTSEVIRTVFAL